MFLHKSCIRFVLWHHGRLIAAILIIHIMLAGYPLSAAAQVSLDTLPLRSFIGMASVEERFEFRQTGDLGSVYLHHTATMLPNGQTLLIGNSDEGRNCASELYDPVTEVWESRARIQQLRARWADTSHLLNNGRVMVAGGYVLLQNYQVLSSAEQYDWISDQWINVADTNIPRWGYMSELLANGDLFVAGGYATLGNITNSAEIYEHLANEWHQVQSMSEPRSSATMTRLMDGRILVVGGVAGYQQYVTTAEIFDPEDKTWSSLAIPLGIRWGHTSTLLPNGHVLIAGGRSVFFDNDGVPSDQYLNDTWIFDPNTASWRQTNSMHFGRWQHSSILLNDGRVLVTGGINGFDTLSSSEIFDPASETWIVIGNMTSARRGHSMTSQANDKVLIVGNDSTAVDIFDIKPSNHFSTTLAVPDQIMVTTAISVQITATSAGASIAFASLGDDLHGWGEWFPVENNATKYASWDFRRSGDNLSLRLRLRDVNGQESEVVTATVTVQASSELFLPVVTRDSS